MNKVELAVCRIREILPENEGSLTRGSGCIVKCGWLSVARGWKCQHVLVTSSNVVHQAELASGKAFVADFLVKDKKGLETFDLKPAADVCVDFPSREFGEIGNKFMEEAENEQSLTLISVDPLDKRGFLKRMVKKSSLQTTRPLECLNVTDETLKGELSEGLYCHVIRDHSQGGNEFSTRTYKFVSVVETGHFTLQDFGNMEISTTKGFPENEMPLGAVIYTKRGEFAGVLDFSGERIAPRFLPPEEHSFAGL